MVHKLIPPNEWLAIILASGIAGTAVMTLFMYTLTFVTDRVMNVTKILGTMNTCQTSHEVNQSNSNLDVTS